MKEYKTGQIRNIALISHNGAGKTTLVERMLFNTGVTTRMGDVQSGTAAMDFEEEEINRHSSVATALAPIEWKDAKINVMDTPGYADFIGEVNAALAVAEGAVVLVEAVAGVEVGTEIVWAEAEKRNLPRVVVINKMDRDNVRAARAYQSVLDNLSGNFIPLQLPIGEGATFKGVVDLLSMEARLGENDERGPIPDDLADAAEEAHLAIVEAAAEGDDALMEKYFENDGLPDEDIIRGLKLAMQQGSAIPVIYSAPQANVAVVPLMNAMVRLFPAPNQTEGFTATNDTGEEVTYKVDDTSPLAAFIFKTREDPYGRMSYLRVYGGILESDSRIWDAKSDSEIRVGSLQILTGKEQNSIAKLHSGDIGAVVKLGDAHTNDTLCDKGNKLQLPAIEQPNPISQVAIHPVSQSDVAKLSQALTRLTIEDPTLKWHTEPATHETILAGMGTTHLDIAVKKAESKFGVHFSTTVPKVPYRETITKTNSAEYTHKKQSGGAGQYARVFLRVESLDDDAEFDFGSEIFGGSISAPFVAATEKGCRQALEAGPVAGFPVVGVKAIVYDGKEHPVDSKEIAFQTAGREGFKQAMLGAGPVLLEPIYEVSVTVPADNMGDILGDMNTRRARVLGMDQEGTKSIVKAEVPLAEMQTYTADLRSMTQGRGVFSMKYLRYGRVPTHMQADVIAKAKAAEEES
ncbi:MAG: elongation factor G [Ardenticatenaceae bacterium]|nr:elongation factor G [Anaerolineales bacterium]MCB8941201.1 elongation factor G [Ardenticatenaceae bacterium]MCB8972539.1 elongation factor G [Ardenticatenaceae bacterium]